MRRPRPPSGCRAIGKKKTESYDFSNVVIIQTQKMIPTDKLRGIYCLAKYLTFP
jgi:hypothetical protein